MSRRLAVKLVRDLRASWPRFALMVVAMAVSLVVFSGVLFTWSASSRATAGEYLGTAPASATLLLDEPLDPDRMAELAAVAARRPGVLAATGRGQFTTGALINGRPSEYPVQVFVAAPADPMELARFQVRGGSWPPGPGEILIGHTAVELLGVAVGDAVEIEAPGVGPVPLRVAGVVYDPALAPAPQEQRGIAYLSSAALPGAGLDQLKIQVADPAHPDRASADRDTVVAVASRLGTWLGEERGLAVREIQAPEPYAHPHQGQTDAVLLSLLAGGVVALLLSGLLVATMLHGVFTQQIPQLGILKAIGARSDHIGVFYLGMVSVVAGAATLAGLPVGLAVGRLGAPAILGFLGIEPDRIVPAGWTYLAVLAAGLALPVLMALPPLVRAARTTVRAAIDHRGLGGGAGRRVRPLARSARGRHLTLALALRNTLRRPARLALSVGLLASAGTVFVAGMSLGDGVTAIAEQAREQRRWDVDVRLATPAPLAEVTAAVSGLPEVAAVEGLRVAEAGLAGPGRIPVTSTYPDQGHGRVTVTAIGEPASRFTPPPVRQGRWLAAGETGAIVLNQVALATTVPGIGPGDPVELTLGGRVTSWRVVGIVVERTAAGGAYVTAAGLAGATGEPAQVNQLRVVTTGHDEQSRAAAAAAVGERLGAAGFEVGSAVSVSRAEAVTENHLGPILMIVVAIAIAMAVVGGIGLASTMSANVLERTREFGILHAIGAPPRTVRRIVTGEGLVVALTSCLVAVLPALGLTALLGAGLGSRFLSAPLPYRISPLAVVIWVLVAAVGAVLATEAAATRAARLTVREAIAAM